MPGPQTLVIERLVVVEKIVYVEKPAPVSAPVPAPVKKARPAHLRPVSDMSLPFFDSPKAVIEEPSAAVIEPVIEAVENAVEGCVRECWGALIAHYQAREAEDADVRALWQQIAEEESAHALLSMDIGTWLSGRLTPGERDVVEAARQRAIADLFAELANDEPARPALGLPDRATRLSLMRTLEARVLRPLAA
jgi:hypothetical protein